MVKEWSKSPDQLNYFEEFKVRHLLHFNKWNDFGMVFCFGCQTKDVLQSLEKFGSRVDSGGHMNQHKVSP